LRVSAAGRAWFRDRFEISRTEATPGYLPGEVMPGTWHIVLGPYTIAPEGMDYRVEVTLNYGPQGEQYRPHYPPEKARGRGRAWYRGDCHLHTVYSDGRRLPAEVAAGAREVHHLHRPQHVFLPTSVTCMARAACASPRTRTARGWPA